MKVNYKDLGNVSIQWNSSFEGILLLKQNDDSKKKKGPRFSEHWCRLKGNILLIGRSSDKTCTEVESIVFLERFAISPGNEEGVLHSFRLVFEAGDSPLVFVARSESEAESWCQQLSSASLSPTLRRIEQIREELRSVTGLDPLDLQAPTTSTDSGNVSQVDEALSIGVEGMELSLACENLPVEMIPGNLIPNIQVVVCVRTRPDSNWTRVGTTELVESCSDPQFLRTVFIPADNVTEKTQVRFEIFDMRDIKSDLGIQIGLVTIDVDRFLPDRKCQFPICDPTTGAVFQRSSADGPNPMLSVELQKHKPAFGGAKSKDYTGPYQLGIICENLLSKRYLFEHVQGNRLHAVEFMGESKLCFEFSVEYLKFLIPREHLLYESLSRIGSSDPRIERLRKERLITMKQVLQQYEACLRHMVDCSGNRFKPSSERTNQRYDFVPTNLHVNQISVTDVDGVTVASHNITSVGAFSASSRSLKSGGLFRTAANTSKSVAPYPPTRLSIDLMCQASPVAAAVCFAENTVAGRAHELLHRGTGFLAALRGDLVGLVQRLSARDQAGPLTERMQRTLSNMHVVFSDSLLSNIHVVNTVNDNFEALFKQLSALSVLDTKHTTPSPSASPVVTTVSDRSRRLYEIQKAGEDLTCTLDKAWDACAEILWNYIFTEFLTLVDCESIGRYGPDAGPAVPNLLAEAERLFVGSPPSVGVDHPLTALAVIFDAFNYRHHASVCQALTSLLSALMASIPSWNCTQWAQVAVCGVLAQFEGLLSCFGTESGMVEDWAWAVDRLSRIRVVLRPFRGAAGETHGRSDSVVKDNCPLARMTNINECELLVPWSVWTEAPAEIQSRGRVRLHIHPVAFVVGINEQQTIAEKLDKTAVQLAVNNQGLASLEAYFQRYTKHYGAPPRSPSGQDVCDLITNIRHALTPPLRSKPVELLHSASEITQAFGGLRFTSCKSAKDRTSMSVTLEQIRWLMHYGGMHEKNFQPALECIRRTGLRMDNVFKNAGCRKYAFNRLQLMSFPRLYRPPLGTYALGVRP